MTSTRTDPVILLVDDEADIREVLEISLVDLGYKVFAAENGQRPWSVISRSNLRWC
jgi:CheY-like chemotaxis protein